MGYKDIYDRFISAIHRGDLKPGERAPSIRSLAQELGVAKKTVESAYDILIGEGYLVSRGPRGTVVNPDLVIDSAYWNQSPTRLEDPDLRTVVDLRDTRGFFQLGIPSLDEFPYKKWLLLSGKAVRSMTYEDMNYPPVMGHLPLRQAIANYLSISRGVNCTADQVFITNGYNSSLRLILEAMASSSDKVVFEEPGYFFGQKLLERRGQNLHYAPVDSEGVNVDFLETHHNDAKLVIITPSHQSPLTVSLSLPRRHQLLNWAQERRAWVIEDDYDGEFHFSRKNIPSLKSLDVFDRVIYVGTFSKTIMPSLRTAYVVIPKALIPQFYETAEIVETGLPLLPQRILESFISSGAFFKHLKRMRSLYESRRRMVRDAFIEIYGDFFDMPLQNGGMHIVAFLKHGAQDRELCHIWQSHNLQVLPLSMCYAQKKHRKYGLVIGYTNIKSKQEAISALRLPYQQTLELL
ncbi:Transcriptional regulator containing a DNA-binding HTH domain and an aminotransferase domain (MocR family) and their eukaryotic orthologs [Hahella chejuensis KCTC 2396]|uniref:Transcriptional regulator containing a DNA-binding HTH domain and an aminotransferase domain (MocR family) and their eukaryotic orthologs n=1 Tax=Hahella chejuensis (strain KCTC 2396) TaxID=349521 RepID=Q2SGY8_HAHCH|nr:PLP-dependent aminotransferase family protein [Hahella chejuensis]ABC30086.1 Transcriptional regulator containing a DNA-binding HTH domain and an aminotransferase domain (MocR family) and their eukaryotic orthologs [Hahella chejuensis KCTC 2396]